MNISFRPIQARDMKALRLAAADWKKIQERRKWGGGVYASLPTWVVTFDSEVVLAFDGNRQVCFQDDRFPIADLIRANMRILEVLAKFDDSALKALKRERSGAKSFEEALKEWVT